VFLRRDVSKVCRSEGWGVGSCPNTADGGAGSLPTRVILIGTYDEDHSEKAYPIQGLRLLVDFEPILESDVMEVVVIHS